MMNQSQSQDRASRRSVLKLGAAFGASALLPVGAARAASDPAVAEGAKKEGTVSLYSSASTGPSNAIAEAFKKKFGINVLVYRAGSADVATRVQSEESAGRTQADALIIEEPGLGLLVPYLAAYDSPERGAIAAVYKQPQSTLIRMYMAQIGWNTNAVKAGAPTDWKDQLDPNASSQDARAEAGRIVARSIANGNLDPNDRTYLAKLVAARTGISQQDAEKRIDDTMAKMKAAAEKAKQAADAARKATASASFYLFFSMLIGAFIASAAGALGGKQRDEF